MRSREWLVLLGLLAGLGVLLVLMGFQGNPTVQSASLAPLSERPAGLVPLKADEIGLQQVASITCTLDYTTTDKTPFFNDSFPEAASIANYADQTLVGTGDETLPKGSSHPTRSDFYRLDNATIDFSYTVSALPDRTTNYDLGIIVYDNNYTAIITDSSAFDGNSASVTLVAKNRGPYYFEIFQRSDQCRGSTYSLALTANAPTATPTHTPTNTPVVSTSTPVPTFVSGFDQYEPNFNFDTATTIAADVTYNANFVPWGGADTDNDYYKLWVKPGLRFTCETFDLAPVVDTNMIIYDVNRNLVAGNDDRTLGDYSSQVSFYSTYEGYLYILVGTGSRLSYQDTEDSSYSLYCEKIVPGAVATPQPGTTPTDAPGKAPTPRATWTPTPPTSPVATPTLTPDAGDDTVVLSVRALTTPPPITPTPTPSGFRTFRLVIYYDNNLDGQFGAGEGVPGFFVRVLDSSRGEELARGYTDEQGQLSFSVPTVGTVRVLVPLLGWDRFVDPGTPEVKVRIVPFPLPDAIP